MRFWLILALAVELSCGPAQPSESEEAPIQHRGSQALTQNVTPGQTAATPGMPIPRHQRLAVLAQQIAALKSKHPGTPDVSTWPQSDRVALESLSNQYRKEAPAVLGSVAPRPTPKRPILSPTRTPEAEAAYLKAKASLQNLTDPDAKAGLRNLKRKLFFAMP